jgi:hypothetical protein
VRGSMKDYLVLNRYYDLDITYNIGLGNCVMVNL